MKKLKLFVAVSFIAHSITAQYTSGMNFIKVGGVQFNNENKEMKDYLPLTIYSDSTQTDSTVYVGKNKADLTLGYYVAVSKNILIGVNSRFLSSEEYSYSISSFGGVIRYAFPLPVGKNTENQIILSKDKSILRNFFFVDYTFLYGNLKYNQFKDTYNSHSLQFGISMRVPTADKKIIRHFGIEIAAGVNYRTAPYGTTNLSPVATGGVQYYFDRKYTAVVKRKKQ